eukprot:TRINITY_DN90_c0_g1_i1.p1 TRINITY_DN90_c0_g1~~TRINITY_DN90_c0_g1_i1.p1  ORF type:complete len:371 (-),score=102.31 TRINITY_DN90_c0_g1_i1:102-1214(-)
MLRSLFGFGGKKSSEGEGDVPNGTLIDVASTKESKGKVPELSAFSGKEGEMPKPPLPKFPETFPLLQPVVGGLPCLKTEDFSAEANALLHNCGVETEGVELNAQYQTSDQSLQVTHTLAFPMTEDQPPSYSNASILSLGGISLVSRFDTSGMVMARIIAAMGNIRTTLNAQIAGSEEERSVGSFEFEHYGQETCTGFKLSTPMVAQMHFSQAIFQGVYGGIFSHLDLSSGDGMMAFGTRLQRKDNLSALSLNTSIGGSPFNASYTCSLNPNLGFAALNNISMNHRTGEIESETSWLVHASYLNSKWTSAIDTNFKLSGNYEENISSTMKIAASFQTNLFDRSDLKMGVKFEFGDSLEKVVKTNQPTSDYY